MENATKALTMAGGILIAIMVIALVYLLVDNISNSRQTDRELEKAKQVAEFNKDFESYNKKLLRGTDLITVINKAIANNEKYLDQDKIYDIDIHFMLKTAVSRVTVTMNGENRKTDLTKTKEVVEFAPNTMYKLIDYKQNDRINAKLKDFMSLGAKQKDSDDGIYTEYIDEHHITKVYDNFKVFKRKIFKCTKMEYSSEGRVNLMVFEELEKIDEMEDFV